MISFPRLNFNILLTSILIPHISFEHPHNAIQIPNKSADSSNGDA